MSLSSIFIAIDGPVGSRKEICAQVIAQYLGFLYIDADTLLDYIEISINELESCTLDYVVSDGFVQFYLNGVAVPTRPNTSAVITCRARRLKSKSFVKVKKK